MLVKKLQISSLNAKKVTNKVHNVSQFTTNNYEEYSLHKLLKIVLVIAQCFAIMPVEGVTMNYEYLKFQWRSFKTIYTICTIFLQLIYTVIVLVYSIMNSENFFSFVVVVWNVRALVGLIFFLKLAQKWPALIQQWSEMEINAISYGPLPSLKIRFHIIIFLSFIMGLVEHIIFIYGGIRGVWFTMKDTDNFIQLYFGKLYGEVFGILNYSVLLALFVEFLALMSTLLWQFLNILLILLSIALAERFQQITKRIKDDQILSEIQWRDIRKQYNRLSLLSKSLNNAIVELILLAFFGNAYFLSTSIFNSFSPKHGYQAMYFWYGIIFTSAHFFGLCLYCAWVHEESLEPLTEISAVPAKYMSHEVERILNQMAAKDIAIYGGGLFKVTRSVILQITSVIVTLQLIFLQFNAKIKMNID